MADVVLVPREPTEAMIEASNREWDGRMSHRSSGAWKAMIAAYEAETCDKMHLLPEQTPDDLVCADWKQIVLNLRIAADRVVAGARLSISGKYYDPDEAIRLTADWAKRKIDEILATARVE